MDHADLISRLLDVIERDIAPVTRKGVARGNKLFGAAILRKSDLSLVVAETNNEIENPLWHGEMHAIKRFFEIPADQRPDVKDCIFLATHEPCSLCLSGITWAGFNEFYYLFTYEDSRDLFGIPYDIDILQEVFRVKGPGDSEESMQSRPLYNRTNKFFTARSFADVVADVQDQGTRTSMLAEIQRVKALYRGLSETYQEGKRAGAESSSVWK